MWANFLLLGDKLIAHHSGMQRFVKCYLVTIASELVHVTCLSISIKKNNLMLSHSGHAVPCEMEWYTCSWR